MATETAGTDRDPQEALTLTEQARRSINLDWAQHSVAPIRLNLHNARAIAPRP